MRFLPYVFKTLWRHRTRSMLTVSGTAVALFVFCFVGAVQEGVRSLRDNRQHDRALVVFQANKFCPATSNLPQDYAQQISRMPGVRQVVPVQVMTNNCRASLDVIVFYGMPAEAARQVRDFDLLSGTWSDFAARQDAALVGRAAAARRELEKGDSFSLGNITVHVAGIYSSADPAEENYIYTHLDFLQRSRGEDRVGAVTQIEVWLQPEADPQQLAKRIDDQFRQGAVATDTRPKSAFQTKSLGDLTQLIDLSFYLGLACLGLVLALVATTTVMSVQDRLQEHAVLQTLGFTGARVATLIVTESVLLSLCGGIIGVAGALLLLAFSHLSIGAEAVTIVFLPSWQLAAVGLAVAAMAGVAAGLFPAWHASRSAIVPALRGH